MPFVFPGKTELDCVSTNNILVRSFKFVMEYFMTFLHKEIVVRTEKLKNSFTLRVLRSYSVIIKNKNHDFFIHAVIGRRLFRGKRVKSIGRCFIYLFFFNRVPKSVLVAIYVYICILYVYLFFENKNPTQLPAMYTRRIVISPAQKNGVRRLLFYKDTRRSNIRCDHP